jgi:hypothetical protein
VDRHHGTKRCRWSAFPLKDRAPIREGRDGRRGRTTLAAIGRGLAPLRGLLRQDARTQHLLPQSSPAVDVGSRSSAPYLTLFVSLLRGAPE